MSEGASSLNRKVFVVVQEPNQSASEQKPANSDEQSGGISFIDNPLALKIMLPVQISTPHEPVYLAQHKMPEKLAFPNATYLDPGM